MTDAPTRPRPARDSVGWGVLGTANIAAAAFLPALRAAGGMAQMVGSRDVTRAAGWAASNDIATAGTYDDVLDSDDVDAVYVALPNHLHVTWAGRALRAGKAVLCEKPMGLTPGEVDGLLTAAGQDALLWESFVFPFHPQTERVMSVIESGRIGALREITSEFHFAVRSPENIRLHPELGGGALYDVGCYPIRLARLLTGSEPISAVGTASGGPEGVDWDMAAVAEFAGDVRLLMSAGMRRSPSTFTRIVGSMGELRVTNPFHPRPGDSVELWVDHELVETWTAGRRTAFEHAIIHVQDVLLGSIRPRHLAVDDAHDQARALELIQSAVRMKAST